MIDSMGIGEIVRAFNQVREGGGTLKLVGTTDRVYGALRITQLLDLIASFPTEAEAVASFGKEKRGRPRKKPLPDSANSTSPDVEGEDD